MSTQGTNYTVANAGPVAELQPGNLAEPDVKQFLGENLGLTGCEASITRLAPGMPSKFVHAHKRNEELYIVLRGSGLFYVDGDEFPVVEGSVVRVAPDGVRAMVAGDAGLNVICIQTETGSLTGATHEDGYLADAKPSWLAQQG